MHSIHPNARTTPAVRRQIARSSEPSGVLARRFGVSTETVRNWRKRGPEACQDRSGPAPQAALEGHAGGAGHCLRPAGGHGLSAR